MTHTVIAAAVQAAPVFLDREATVAKAARLISQAAADGAGLIAFPEAFLPTYPDWVWRTPPWTDGAANWYQRLLDQAVSIPGPATRQLGKAARAARAHVSIGVNELAGATLYNTQLWLGPDGDVLGAHRKLMPTGGERLVWGYGDGSTMPVLDTPVGRLGGLICWENYLPLACYSLYAQDMDVLVAPTWDNSDMWVPTMRHIAKEGRIPHPRRHVHRRQPDGGRCPHPVAVGHRTVSGCGRPAIRVGRGWGVAAASVCCSQGLAMDRAMAATASSASCWPSRLR